MANIFTDIIARKIPAHIIAEDDKQIAFLDAKPITIGHTLVIPKVEIDYIFDLDDNELASLHIFAKKVASAMKKALQAERIVVIIEGFEVPHAHIHLIPVNHSNSMHFIKQRLNLVNIDFKGVKEKIKKFIQA
jgi:histidine triad (HIT) family protein